MTFFEHLSVLISIVLGLGMAHLLASVHKLVQARARVRWYWLPLLWTALIFITQVEWWWAIFSFEEKVQWNFFYFFFVLLSPVTLYLAAAFVLPDVDQGETTDLRVYYYQTHRAFFAMVALGPVLDAIRRGIEAGSFRDFGAVSNAVSAVLVGALAVSDNERLHTIITLAVTALFLFFLASEAITLTRDSTAFL
jgi:hypothetical protein